MRGSGSQADHVMAEMRFRCYKPFKLPFYPLGVENSSQPSLSAYNHRSKVREGPYELKKSRAGLYTDVSVNPYD